MCLPWSIEDTNKRNWVNLLGKYPEMFIGQWKIPTNIIQVGEFAWQISRDMFSWTTCDLFQVFKYLTVLVKSLARSWSIWITKLGQGCSYAEQLSLEDMHRSIVLWTSHAKDQGRMDMSLTTAECMDHTCQGLGDSERPSGLSWLIIGDGNDDRQNSWLMHLPTIKLVVSLVVGPVMAASSYWWDYKPKVWLVGFPCP